MLHDSVRFSFWWWQSWQAEAQPYLDMLCSKHSDSAVAGEVSSFGRLPSVLRCRKVVHFDRTWACFLVWLRGIARRQAGTSSGSGQVKEPRLT